MEMLNDIIISTYRKIQCVDGEVGSVHLATCWDAYPFIVFNKIPKVLRQHVEEYIEEIIEHEELHLVMNKLMERGASSGFDKLFPKTRSFRELTGLSFM